MKTFREFMLESVEPAQDAWDAWMKANPQEFARGGRFYDKRSTEKVSKASKEFMKSYIKTGKPPAGFEVKTTKVSGQDVRGTAQTPPKQQQAPRQEPPKATQTPPKQPSGSTQTPPRGAQTDTQAPPKQSKASQSSYRGRNVGNKVADDYETYMRNQSGTPKNMANMNQRDFERRYGGNQKAQTARDIGKEQGYGSSQTPPKQPKASTPPPPKPPTSNAPAPSAKPPTAAPKGPGLRSRLGKLANPAGSAVSAGIDYKERRDAGQSRQRAAGGALSSLAGYAKGAEYGAKLGAKLPIPAPMWVKAGAGGLIGGTLGQQGASAAYDFAADKSRPARQAVSKATGFDKFQQKNALIKQGSGLQKAQQTVDTRSTRAASSAYGTKKGSALTGIGGKTFTSKDAKGNAFMSTGAGKQRQTVQLSKTQLVRDPKTGKQVVGDLAFKGGKATYLARPSVASRDTSLGARVGRALNIGRYSKEAEQQAAKQEYRTALKNTQTYQKKLGITPQSATTQKLPARGVGPAKVGPKLVGPKIVGPTKPQSPTKPLIKPA
jgi:hypothetical protein